LFASFSARADDTAASAEAAVHTESLRIGAVLTYSAFLTKLIGTVGTDFTAGCADCRAVRTPVAAGADHSDTSDTQ